MKSILGKKQGMSQVFNEDGRVLPVTVIFVESDPSVFIPGELVRVSGISKGKGFQGVVKRHGFHGGPRTHGQKHSEREPGSIGSTGPQRVFKGVRMAGRMGGERVTVRNLTIAEVDREKNLLFVSGAVPGRRGTVLKISALTSEDKKQDK